MESQVVRRRVSMIAGHFATGDDISTTATATATQVFPLNCSSVLNSVTRRYDNRINFARQGSSSQACFMRQVSTEQNCSSVLNSVTRRYDNRVNFARQGSSSQACFMRQASTEQGSNAQSGVPFKCTSSADEVSSNALEAPLFSRPCSMEPNVPKFGFYQPEVKDCKLSAPQPPRFARPNSALCGQVQFCSSKKTRAFGSDGSKWSPRMDTGESGSSYVVTVELPGVSTNNIRVEVDDKFLTVTGNRSIQWQKVATCSNDSLSAYDKREILQGPYQVVWPLPANVNKDSISAEFVDGLLRIIVAKV